MPDGVPEGYLIPLKTRRASSPPSKPILEVRTRRVTSHLTDKPLFNGLLTLPGFGQLCFHGLTCHDIGV